MNGTENQVHIGPSDIRLRDTVRISGQTMATSDSGRTHGLFTAEEVRQAVRKRRGRKQVLGYTHRIIYTLCFISLALGVVHWG